MVEKNIASDVFFDFHNLSRHKVPQYKLMKTLCNFSKQARRIGVLVLKRLRTLQNL